MKLASILFVAFFFCSSCVTDGQSEHAAPSAGLPVEHLTFPQTAALNLPFSEAVRVGGTLYLSGQVGNLPGTVTLAPGGIQPETKQTLENIRAILERNGLSMADIFKCTVMLADISEWPAMNEVYVTYFSRERLPARSAFAASGLALGARVEIECMAASRERPAKN